MYNLFRGLKNKCISNQKLYEKNKPNFKNTSNNRNTKLPSDPVLNGAGMDLAYY